MNSFLNASSFTHLSAINETPNQVLGHKLIALETHQEFTQRGTVVRGGNAIVRNWTDKTFIPITLSTECIDCLHCVVACPHHSIHYEVEKISANVLTLWMQKAANFFPGIELNPITTEYSVKKAETNYSHCKGCFVCASACPTGAIHFVPLEYVDTARYPGIPVSPNQLSTIFKAPSDEGEHQVHTWILLAGKVIREYKPLATPVISGQVFNGSSMLGEFVFQALYDCVSIFPITPNTSVIKYVEENAAKQKPEDAHQLVYRPCLSEEAGYAWLTGAAVQGKRCMMAQGSQSLAQIYEFMNINPGLHLPILMLELTRSLAPGTTTKADHTTTYRTADTGEIILMGRSLQDNYDKAFLLTKLMESPGIWLPGRLVIKGFIETHTLISENQGHLQKLTDAQAHAFVARPANPFAFDLNVPRSVGVLDLDSRYAEQRQAMDQVLVNAGLQFDGVAEELSKLTGRLPLRQALRYPESGPMDFCVVGLNDPDMASAEYICDLLRVKGIACGVVSINLFRPFPIEVLRACLKGCKSIVVVEYNNWSGRAGGGMLAQEVRSALYDLEKPPFLIAVQMGLGGRAVTTPHWLVLFRMLSDLSHGVNTKTHTWLHENAPNHSFVMGTRGNVLPDTDANFDVPLMEEGVRQIVVVGKGGQGLLKLNSLFAGVANLRNQFAVFMTGFGALQRGGGITLSLKIADKPIRDCSDIIMADTIMAFDDDLSLVPMLGQLCRGGILIVDGEDAVAEKLQPLMPKGGRIALIPAKRMARRIYGNGARTNMVLFGSMLANMGIESPHEVLQLMDGISSVKGVEKESRLLQNLKNREAAVAGFIAYHEALQGSSWVAPKDEIFPDSDSENLQAFQSRILLPHLKKALTQPKTLRRWEKIYALKKSLYQFMFQLHPTVNQIQSMYIGLRGKTPLTAGDMACAGCGQINIFRTTFNFLHYLHGDKGKIFVSEQDGCGTVFSGMNQTSIWNLPYIRIAFETAHGVAAGLSHNVGTDDMVVSISGDGGFIQGLRSVEDALHQQDPIFHIVVVNQMLGNTGGQATASTMVGAKTSEGHISSHEPMNFLKYAEKYSVQGAVATTVHLSDLYRKIKWGRHVVVKEKKPFLLILHFSCLEQGMNLARCLGAQKMALDAHFFNLHSLRYIPVKANGKVLYVKKKTTIDWYPWTFGKKRWKQKLKQYYEIQSMMHASAHDEVALERDYWQLRGEWKRLAQEMGWLRFYGSMLRNMFSIHRATLSRLIHIEIPKEAKI